MATKREKQNTKTADDVAILLDRVLHTSKGDLHVLVDYRNYLNDVEDYRGKLMRFREIPFDLSAIPAADQRVFEASQKFSYIEDENQVLAMVAKFYESMTAQASTDASILAMTRKNPPFTFDPEPYPAPEVREEWEMGTDFEPYVNDLTNPMERRLKCVIDMISDSAETMQFFQNYMRTMFITAERKAREVDRDGFRSGRANGNSDASALAVSPQQEA